MRMIPFCDKRVDEITYKYDKFYYQIIINMKSNNYDYG